MADFTLIKANPTQGEITSSLTGSTGDGAGLHFDGSGVVAATPVDLGSKFSHEFVISTSEDLTAGSSKYIIDYHGAAGRFIIGVHPTNSNGNIAIFDRSSWVSFGVNPLTDLKVHHLVVTVSGTSAVLYDNGNEVATATINAGHNIWNASNVGLGGYYNNSNNFEGTIYRARTYNKALTSAEVQTAYERADVDYADQYGSQTELVTNGTFAADSNWTKGTGWSIGSGVASSDGTQTGNSEIYQSVSFTAGKRYRLSYEVTAFTSGQVRFLLGSGGTGGTWRSATGTYVEEFVADSASTSNLHIQANSTFVGSIDNVSFKAIGCVSDYQTQWANPSQSLTVQDASGAADGTCSASGVTQVQPVVQLNSTSARIGTTAATPADGQLIIGAGGSGGTASAHADELLIDNNGNSGITIASGASDYGGINFSDSGNNSAGIVRYDHSNNSLKLYTQTTERLAINSSGQITTTTTSADAMFIDSSHATRTSAYIRNSNATTNNTAELSFAPANSVAGAKIVAEAKEDFSVEANRTADLVFHTRNNGTMAEAMRIDASGNVNVTGGQLSIKSDSSNDTPGRLNLWATDTSIVANDTIGAIHAQGTDTVTSPPEDGAKIEFNADFNWGGSTNYQAARIDFFTQDNSGTNTLTSPRLTISSDGAVTVNETAGSATNAAKLEVRSDADGSTSAIRTTNKDVTAGTNQAAGIDFGLSRNSGAFKPQAGQIKVGREADWTASDTNIDSYMAFSTYENNALGERMRITSTGQVGVGKSPDTTFEVAASSAHARITGNSGTSPELQLSSAGAVNWKLRSNVSSSDFRITKDSTDHLTISSTGLCTFANGIAFQSATTGSGTGTGYTLDAYEQGTYTATITGETTAGTHSNILRQADYIRIGNLCTVYGYYYGTDGTGSGNMILGGLPFDVKSGTAPVGSIQANSGLSITSGTWPQLIFHNTNMFKVRCSQVDGSAFHYAAYPTAPSYVRWTITYIVA